MAVKVLSAPGATAAEVSSAQQEMRSKAYAAQACSQVVKVFGHCTKDQQVCLVVLPHEDTLVTLLEGKPSFICQLWSSEHQALCIFEYGIK